MPRVSRVPITVSYKGKRIPVSEYTDKEHEALRSETYRFQQQFSQLETSLGDLLHGILNAKRSKVPYAIFYSTISFAARADMVRYALQEAIAENTDLAPLSAPTRWPYISDKIDQARSLRNLIAHGSTQTLDIRSKPYVRHLPPVYDVIRVLPIVAKRQIPGLTRSDIVQGRAPLLTIVRCIEAVKIVVREAHEKVDTLPDSFADMDNALTALRALYPTPKKTGANAETARPAVAPGGRRRPPHG
jgi:hypothetical protein